MKIKKLLNFFYFVILYKNMSKSSTFGICSVLLIAVVILLALYFVNLNKQQKSTEKFSTSEVDDEEVDINTKYISNNNKPYVNRNIKKGFNDPTNGPGTTNSFNNKIIGNSNAQNNVNTDFKTNRESSCFPKNQLTAAELLPQDNSSTWAQVNPSGSGTLKDKNFLQAGHHIGINTVGQTMRNANMQLRSEPPNPQVKVSPWLQTTIEPDMGRKPLEIGGCN